MALGFMGFRLGLVGFMATWRFMGTYNPHYKSTYNLLRGLRGLISAVLIGLQVP